MGHSKDSGRLGGGNVVGGDSGGGGGGDLRRGKLGSRETQR